MREALTKLLGGKPSQKADKPERTGTKGSKSIRGRMAVLQQVPDKVLLEGLYRRVRLQKERQQGAERQRRRRERLSRKKA